MNPQIHRYINSLIIITAVALAAWYIDSHQDSIENCEIRLYNKLLESR